MAVVRVRRGQITIPAELRRAANVRDGDTFAVSVDNEGTLTLTPSLCEEAGHPASDWRYWSGPGRIEPANPKGDGRVMTTEEFLAYMDSLAADRGPERD